ncbi:MAG: DEAD/DEAH box helicase family protein [Candidatus Bathyarchaeota archaeon]|nr:DEAD/DEAH box helicase family protein [Candidatus Bathyarchaeota archaeon]
MTPNTSEKGFQNDIIAHLVSTGYQKRITLNFNKDSCLDPELTLKFIHDTQEKEWMKFERIYGGKSEEKFLFRLIKELDSKGTIHILRSGFKDSGCDFKLFYPKPYNNKNLDLFEKFDKNIFSVIDELEYQEKEKGNRIDLVLFINGLPILSVELKDTFSQGVERAIKQYKETRDHRETVFQRMLVHFAMSDEKIYYSTKLAGPKTEFLPFNKGLENPEVPDNYKTAYLYNDILQINKLSKLISNFIYMKKDAKTGEEKPIFPRYHQFECVNMLLEDPKIGQNFLIQHSAGSGKTNTIAWLSHGLVNKFDKEDNRLYDMVIVVSDRKVIDKQLRDQVQGIEKVKGMVEVIDEKKHSSDLFEALKMGHNIVVTTIQKFPHILEGIKELPNRKYAVIIDEAHSSQAGANARALKRVLTTNSLDEAEKLDSGDLEKSDEDLLKEIEAVKSRKNISFFAFTATPKNKTLEMFGCPKADKNGKLILNENGEPELFPFHLYTMKQAIEEGFILDVLQNYISYETYFKLFKKIKDDPEFDEKKTKKLLRDFVEKNPVAVAKKTEIMLHHFMNSSAHKIDGKAKAMIVTRSRLHAVLYKKAFDKLIQEENCPIKALVAFTGVVKHDEQEYTEDSMNNLPSRTTIESAFSADEYKLLIVANKFQTGFDQPLLHTLYVDKMLNGITAVQTLSRANRINPGKSDTFVLDFANKPEVIQKSFEPYYEVTYLSEATDPHKLYELQDKLLDYQIFEMKDVENFFSNWRRNVSQPKLHAILNPIVESFKQKRGKDQVDFKKTLNRYQSMYGFLSQLIPFSDLALEKLYLFNKFLQKKLPTINNPLSFSVLEDVDIESYKIVNKGQKEIKLSSDGELKPISATVGKFAPEIKEKLSKIISALNDAFGTDFNEDDRVFLGTIQENLLKNKDLQKKLEHNSKENVKVIFNRYFDDEMTKLLNSNMKFYKRIVDNEKLREKLKSALFDLVYYQYVRQKKKTDKVKASKKPPDNG